MTHRNSAEYVLLERKTLRLGYKEHRIDEGAGAEASPDEEDRGLEVALVGADHVGGDDGDDGVPEPVGGRRETDTARTDGQGWRRGSESVSSCPIFEDARATRLTEDLADENPCCRSRKLSVSVKFDRDRRQEARVLTSRTPGGGEEEDGNGDESNLRIDGGKVVSDRFATLQVGLVEA